MFYLDIKKMYISHGRKGLNGEKKTELFLLRRGSFFKRIVRDENVISYFLFTKWLERKNRCENLMACIYYNSYK